MFLPWSSPRADRPARVPPSQRRRHRPTLERLEERCLLSADFTMVQPRLHSLLAAVRDAVTTEVYGVDLPLAGSSFQNSGQAKFLAAIDSTVNQELLADNPTTAAALRTSLFTALNGLGLFPAGSTAAQVITIDSTDANNVKFTMHLAH